VREQQPGLTISPGAAFDPTAGFGAVRVRLPLSAGCAVLAAEAAREAARAEVDSAVLDAIKDAREARSRHAASLAELAAARARLLAANDLLKTAKARVSVASGSITDVVYAADSLVMGSRGVREALVAEARARVRAARAAGWPAP